MTFETVEIYFLSCCCSGAYFQEAIQLLMLKYWSYMYIQQFPNNIIDVPWYLQI